jgi:hypothetical protein
MPIAQFNNWAEAWRPDPLWRDRQPIARDDLPLMFAMVEHRAWMKAVEDQLNGDKQKVLPLDERLCKFGQWLNSEARQRYAQSGALQPIIGMHHQIHQTAPRLFSLHRQGDRHSADAVLNELRGVSNQMQCRLRALLRQ